ncbi:MAG: DMT family transporter [Trueperaceae bacterium]
MPEHRRAALSAFAHRRPLVLVAAGVCFYSVGPVFVAASDASGPVFSFWRSWMGVVVMGLANLVAVVTKGTAWPTLRDPSSRRAWRFAAAAGAAFGLHQLCFFTAVKATSVTDVVLMNTLAPIIVTVAAIRLFGERPGLRFRLWTLLAMAGAAVVVLGASTGPQGNPFGMLLAFVNVGFFMVFFLVSKQGRQEISVLPFLFGVMLVSACTVSTYVLIAGEAVSGFSTRDAWFAAAVAIGPGGVGHFVMTWPLRWVAANIPPVMRLAQPALAGFLAWLWLGQPVHLSHLVGGALTIAGVAGALLSKGGRSLRGSEPDAGSSIPVEGGAAGGARELPRQPRRVRRSTRAC